MSTTSLRPIWSPTDTALLVARAAQFTADYERICRCSHSALAHIYSDGACACGCPEFRLA